MRTYIKKRLISPTLSILLLLAFMYSISAYAHKYNLFVENKRGADTELTTLTHSTIFASIFIRNNNGNIVYLRTIMIRGNTPFTLPLGTGVYLQWNDEDAIINATEIRIDGYTIPYPDNTPGQTNTPFTLPTGSEVHLLGNGESSIIYTANEAIQRFLLQEGLTHDIENAATYTTAQNIQAFLEARFAPRPVRYVTINQTGNPEPITDTSELNHTLRWRDYGIQRMQAAIEHEIYESLLRDIARLVRLPAPNIDTYTYTTPVVYMPSGLPVPYRPFTYTAPTTHFAPIPPITPRMGLWTHLTGNNEYFVMERETNPNIPPPPARVTVYLLDPEQPHNRITLETLWLSPGDVLHRFPGLYLDIAEITTIHPNLDHTERLTLHRLHDSPETQLLTNDYLHNYFINGIREMQAIVNQHGIYWDRYKLILDILRILRPTLVIEALGTLHPPTLPSPPPTNTVTAPALILNTRVLQPNLAQATPNTTTPGLLGGLLGTPMRLLVRGLDIGSDALMGAYSYNPTSR